jgi:NAD(P)-dependent dehydrogenase (short-subunit alcohol dehydrogenase family)
MAELADKEVPMGRIGKPDDIANSALFFASDMSKYVTGLRMYVAGGLGYINNPGEPSALIQRGASDS